MIQHTYMTALTHSDLNIELDLGVVPVGTLDFGEGRDALYSVANRLYPGAFDLGFVNVDPESPGEALLDLVAEVLDREAGMAGLANDRAYNRPPELTAFIQYAVMAPVVPVENSWPAMTSLWSLVTAVGGGAVAGASFGMVFTPVGAAVGAIVGAGSTVLVGASKGAGDAAGRRLGRRILRAGEATDLRSRLEEIDKLVQDGMISPQQAEAAKATALNTFASG